MHGMANYQTQTNNGEFKSERCRDAMKSSVGRLITSSPMSGLNVDSERLLGLYYFMLNLENNSGTGNPIPPFKPDKKEK